MDADADADAAPACDAMVVTKREPSPVGVRPSLSLSTGEGDDKSDVVRRYTYGGAALVPLGDVASGKVVLGFKSENGEPPPGTHAARIMSEYNLGPLARAQLHVVPGRGLELQALRNDDRDRVFGEILLQCGSSDTHPPFAIVKRYMSDILPPHEDNDLFSYIYSRRAETRRLWPQLWAQLLEVGAALHQGGTGIVHHDIKPENLVVEAWRLDPPAVRLRLIDFEHARPFPTETDTHVVYALPEAWPVAQREGVRAFRVDDNNHTAAYAAAALQLPVLLRGAAAGGAGDAWSITSVDLWSIAMTAYVAFTGHFMVPMDKDARYPHYVILAETRARMAPATRPDALPWDPSRKDDPRWTAEQLKTRPVVEVTLSDVHKSLLRAAGDDPMQRRYATDVFQLFQLSDLLAFKVLPTEKIYQKVTALPPERRPRMLPKMVALAERMAPPSAANPFNIGNAQARSLWDVLRAGAP